MFSEKICSKYYFTFALGLFSGPLLVRPAPPRGGPNDHVPEVALVRHDGVVGHGHEDGLAVVRVLRDVTLHRFGASGKALQEIETIRMNFVIYLFIIMSGYNLGKLTHKNIILNIIYDSLRICNLFCQ